MTPEIRKLSLKILKLESASDSLEMADPDFSETLVCAFLNLSTGEIAWPETDDEALPGQAVCSSRENNSPWSAEIS